MDKISRRDFFVRSGMVTIGCISSMGMIDRVFSPPRAHAGEITFPESSCGSKQKKVKKILIAYASQCGSTGDVAEAIGKVFCHHNLKADIRLVQNVTDIVAYDGVVIGSAIHSSKWMPAAEDFFETNQQRLTQIPVACFLTCLTLYQPTPQNQKRAVSFLQPLLEANSRIKPISLGTFAGKLDYSKLSPVVRLFMRRKMKRLGIPEGDFRDWRAIRAWAESIVPDFR